MLANLASIVKGCGIGRRFQSVSVLLKGRKMAALVPCGHSGTHIAVADEYASRSRELKRLWKRPLARELTIVLVVKLVLIIGIKIVFFSDPFRPGSEGTAKALLTPVTINTQGVSSHE